MRQFELGIQNNAPGSRPTMKSLLTSTDESSGSYVPSLGDPRIIIRQRSWLAKKLTYSLTLTSARPGGTSTTVKRFEWWSERPRQKSSKTLVKGRMPDCRKKKGEVRRGRREGRRTEEDAPRQVARQAQTGTTQEGRSRAAFSGVKRIDKITLDTTRNPRQVMSAS